MLIPLGFQTHEMRAEDTQAAAPKPIETIKDIMACKSISLSALSKDGHWFAYRLAPAEGDGEVIIRDLRSDKEYKFPAGEGRGGSILFNDSGKWAAFTAFPTAKEAKSLNKQKKRVYNSMALVDLSNGEKTDFEKVRSFAFSGENPAWLAIHKYAPESQAKEKDKWDGSDLILMKPGTDIQFNIGNVSLFAFNKDGSWLAWAIDASGQSGNGVQARSMASGVIHSLDSGKAVYKRLTWTEKGEALAVLKGREDEDFEDELYSLVGFTGFPSSNTVKTVYDPHKDKDFPDGLTISPNQNPQWTDSLDGIFFGIHEVKRKEKKEKKEPETKDKAEEEKTEEKAEKKTEKKAPPEKEVDKEDLPGLVIWHWKDKRLQAQQQVQANRDKNFSYLCLYRTKEKKFLRLADDSLRNVQPVPMHRYAMGYDNSKYELMGNLEGRRYQDIYVIDLKTGERTLALEKARWVFTPSPDGTHFFYYTDGHIFTYDMASDKAFNLPKMSPHPLSTLRMITM